MLLPAAAAVLTFDLTDMYIPTNPDIEEQSAPRIKASDVCQP